MILMVTAEVPSPRKPTGTREDRAWEALASDNRVVMEAPVLLVTVPRATMEVL